MSNHNYTRAGGVWNTATGLTAAELADLDWKSTNSLSALGGVYSFDDSMVIGGSSPLVEWQFEVPVVFVENLTSYDGFTFYGDGTIGISTADTLDVNTTTDFWGPVDFNGSVDYYDIVYFNSTVDFWSGVEFHGPTDIGDGSSDLFTVRASATFQSPVTLQDQLNAPVTCLLGDSTHSVNLNGQALVFKPIRIQSGGALVQRATTGANADTTYSPLTWHEVVVLDGSLTGSVAYTIDDTGCTGNEEIIFTNKDQTHTVVAKRPDGSNLGSFSGGWRRCKRIAGTWQVVQLGTSPA